jgi:tetratricopeptide (TPR) repeat protein
MKNFTLFILLCCSSAFAQMPATELDASLKLLMGNDQQTAVDNLTAIEKKYPGTAEALFLRGIYQYRDGDNNAALMNFSNAIKANPSFSMAYDGRAKVMFEKGMTDKAIADVSVAIKLDPTNADLLAYRSSYYKANKQYKEALEDAKAKIKLKPDGIYGYTDAASFAKLMDPNYDADQYFVKAYANKNIDKFLLDLLYGKFLLENGRFADAKVRYESALAVSEKDFYADELHELGVVYYKLKLYEKAEQFIKKAINLVPNNITYRVNLCSVYLDLQQYSLVKATAQDALAVDSENPLANMFMAIGLQYTGNESLAMEYEAKAKRLDAALNKN